MPGGLGDACLEHALPRALAIRCTLIRARKMRTAYDVPQGAAKQATSVEMQGPNKEGRESPASQPPP